MSFTQEPMHLSIMGAFWGTISLYIVYRPTLFIFITFKIYVFVSLYILIVHNFLVSQAFLILFQDTCKPHYHGCEEKNTIFQEPVANQNAVVETDCSSFDIVKATQVPCFLHISNLSVLKLQKMIIFTADNTVNHNQCNSNACNFICQYNFCSHLLHL